MNNQQKVGAVIVAAGESRRMDGMDKVFAPLGGKPALAHVLMPLKAVTQLTR